MDNSKALSALALNGGEKAVKHPFPARGHFGAEEKAEANRIIDEAIAKGVAPGYGGVEETEFCKEFAEMLGGGYADAVNSGTTALYVALRALDIEPFTEIIVPPVTDPGGIMPIVMMNCIPVVADAAPDSFNVSLETVKARVTERTSAIVVAHIAGEPADIEPICAFARERGIKVVEDAAQSHGAKINGRFVGTFGDSGAFSMMFGKHTCVGGQGGVVFTRDEATYWKARQCSDRGKPFGAPASNGNVTATLNYNMDELHAAIGRAQIKKTQSIAENRRRVADGIFARLEAAGVKAVVRPPMPAGAEASHWFLRLIYRPEFATVDKATFCAAVNAEGVACGLRYGATPYTGDWYTKRNVFGTSGYPWAAPEYKGDRDKYYTLADVPTADKSLNDTIMIHPFESWTDINIDECANAFIKAWEAYKK